MRRRATGSSKPAPRAKHVKKEPRKEPPAVNEAQKEADDVFFNNLRSKSPRGTPAMDFAIGAPVKTPRDDEADAAKPSRRAGVKEKLVRSRSAGSSSSNSSLDDRAIGRPNSITASGGYNLTPEDLEADRLIYEKYQKEKSKNKKVLKGKKSALGSNSSSNVPGNGKDGRKPAPLGIARKQSQQSQQMDTSTEKETRRNLDKRTARIRHSPHFKAFISHYRNLHPNLNSNHNHREAKFDDNPCVQRTFNGVSVFVRKRPLFKYESKNNDFDIVSVSSSSTESADRVILHSCTMHPDMKRMMHKPIVYSCSAAFDQHASNADVYDNVASDMVKKIKTGKGVSTILMYGQTGSGKTYTMTAIEKQAVADLFAASDNVEGDAYDEEGADDEHVTPPPPPTITVKYIELCGKKAIDLFGRRAGEEVRIIDEVMGMGHDENEIDDNAALKSKFLEGEYDPDDEAVVEKKVKVVWKYAQELTVKSPEQLLKFIDVGKGRRATEATDVNGTSSRSHAVLQIAVTKNDGSDERGVLTLIDCAGSERRNDSLYHSKERQMESNEINASLYALKECIRARVNSKNKPNTYIPYRSSLLTRVLRESFEDPNAFLSIIATAAPTATDTEHTMETLKTVSTIVGLETRIAEGDNTFVSPAHELRQNIVNKEGGQGGKADGGPAGVMPVKWSEMQLRNWLVKSNGGMFSCVEAKLKKGDNGKFMMSLTAAKMAGENGLLPDNMGLSVELYNKLREEGERTSKKIEVERKAKILLLKGLDG
jgi:kinesin family protein 2/24